jgi:hypothetical protein
MWSRNLCALLACLALPAGCGGDDRHSGGDTRERDRKSDSDADAEGDRERETGSKTGDCRCALDEVCDAATGHCIDTPDLSPNDRYGEILLMRQDRIDYEGEEEQRGVADAEFFDWEDPPTDHLQEYFNEDDELCTVHPGGVDARPWPSGRQRSAGRLTLEARGGEGPIVLEPDAFPPEEEEAEGVDYTVKEPATIEGGDTAFADVSHVPLESIFELEASGSDEIGALRFTGGEMPEDFEVLSPAPLGDDDPWPLGQDLEVRWSPTQGNAVMEVGILFIGNEVSFVRCLFTDDGSGRVPREAMPNDEATAFLVAGREAVRYREVDADGTKVHLRVTGRRTREYPFCYGGGCQ